ncbi:MAG TPA: excinuclease ABC subunit UvrA, partial [Planctomycetota bacterium]|nr:excinuclease ABC subunit UvrA [Planctomycetota bacterium]
IKPWTTPSTAWERRDLAKWCAKRGVPTGVPYAKLPADAKRWLWDGEPGGYAAKKWWGVKGWFEWLESRTYKMHVRVLLSRYRSATPCAACGGARFRPEVLKTRVEGRSIAQLAAMPIAELRDWFERLPVPASLASAVDVVLGEIRSRLGYLCEVGLGYLTLDRTSRTLSGGEMERVNLTTAVGSRLVNALFVLDEPSVGLHPRDNDRLIAILRRLVAQGNTVVVVEHDPALLLAADELIDLGPEAGEGGGRIVYQGPPARSAEAPDSATGAYLSGTRRVEHAPHRRPTSGPAIEVRAARAHNLKRVDARFPLHAFTVVTGVSGSGKSTLVEEVLYRSLRRARGERADEPGASAGVTGGDRVAGVTFVDTAPIGKSPKSIVATASGAYERMRKALAALPEARERRLTPATFSFNTKGGRCEACEGAGFERVEMQFLADVFLPCPECGGDRFRPEVRRVRLRGKTIGEILNLTVVEAARFFAEDDPEIGRRLAPLESVGLGYLRIGQSVTALSGGEAQRLKLAAAIADDSGEPGGRRRGTLFLFDEPTTGLHLADVAKLLATFDRLLDAGHTIVAIEHHLDLIAHADHVIDLGPESGPEGGEVVAAGTPEEIAACAESTTGRYLRAHLGGGPAPPLRRPRLRQRPLTTRRSPS